MLAGIIQTIIMALGIATGNVSSNVYKGGNVFNDVEKSQPIKKQNSESLETINITETFTSLPSDYVYTYNQATYAANKCYIGTQRSSNYNNAYLYINNTLYTMGKYNKPDPTAEFFGIYEITNYYNSNLDFELNINFDLGDYYTYYYGYSVYSNPNNLDQYIDRTLTSTTHEMLLELYTTATTTGNQLRSYDSQTQQSATTITIGSNSGAITLTPQEKITLFYYTYMINKTNTSGISAYPSSMHIFGTVAVPIVNYEIVDIPGVIYTILTMPFSFISTAFNLTVFPGTPYQLNFGNLFLTLIAVFILLWIIKKVFH